MISSEARIERFLSDLSYKVVPREACCAPKTLRLLLLHSTQPPLPAMPTLRLGNIAPDFEAETTQGPIKFHEWIGDSWVCHRPRSKRVITSLTAPPYRPSCSPTQETSPPSARPSLLKSPAGTRTLKRYKGSANWRAGSRTSRSAM